MREFPFFYWCRRFRVGVERYPFLRTTLFRLGFLRCKIFWSKRVTVADKVSLRRKK